MRKKGIAQDLSFRAMDEKIEKAFKAIMALAVMVPFVILAVLLIDTAVDGLPRLGWDFLTGFPSRFAARAGILSPLAGSAILMILTAAIALPLGIGAAIYLEEYAGKNAVTAFIEINISNL